MTTMTNSGANVYVNDGRGVATKFSVHSGPVADRIDLQAEWLQEHADLRWLPRVLRTFPGGYVMEALTALPDFVDDELLTVEIIKRLRELWKLPSSQGFDPGSHAAYVLKRASQVSTGAEMMDWLDAVLPTILELAPCRVHGDPTWDNCMLRGDGSLVITDPLTPGLKLPSIRALDVAKVLQSLLGYEEVVSGRRHAARVHLRLEMNMPDEEWQVVLYLTAVHFLRLLPYTPQHKHAWQARVRELLDHREVR